MTSLSQAKTLGAIGSILIVLTAVPSFGVLFGIVGFVLVLVAIKYISDAVADRSIFNDMLIGVILAIAGVITGTVVIVASVFRFFGLNYTTLMNSGSTIKSSSIPAGDWLGLLGSVLIGLAVVWVMLLVSAIFVRRSYTKIGSRLNVSMFGKAGLVYLIGAATTIILVGFILLFVAQLLLVLAFFSIGDAVPPPTTSYILAPGQTNVPSIARPYAASFTARG